MMTQDMGQTDTEKFINHSCLPEVNIPVRRVVSSQPEPGQTKRWLFVLDCGHTVSRRTNGAKRRALCGLCA